MSVTKRSPIRPLWDMLLTADFTVQAAFMLDTPKEVLVDLWEYGWKLGIKSRRKDVDLIEAIKWAATNSETTLPKARW